MEDSPAQRWSMRFVDLSVERRYRDERGPAARRRIRVLFPVPGRVQVDGHTRDLLCGAFTFEDRGTIEIKGKGPVQTYFLLAEDAAASGTGQTAAARRATSPA